MMTALAFSMIVAALGLPGMAILMVFGVTAVQ